MWGAEAGSFSVPGMLIEPEGREGERGGEVTILAAARGVYRNLKNHRGADPTVEGLFQCFRLAAGAPVGPADGLGF